MLKDLVRKHKRERSIGAGYPPVRRNGEMGTVSGLPSVRPGNPDIEGCFGRESSFCASPHREGLQGIFQLRHPVTRTWLRHWTGCRPAITAATLNKRSCVGKVILCCRPEERSSGRSADMAKLAGCRRTTDGRYTDPAVLGLTRAFRVSRS